MVRVSHDEMVLMLLLQAEEETEGGSIVSLYHVLSMV